MLHSFASRSRLTEEEEREVVVLTYGDCHSSQYLLVGKLLAHENYNKDAFMSFFRNLWCPRVEVTIQALSGDCFLFAFHRTRTVKQFFMGVHGRSRRCCSFLLLCRMMISPNIFPYDVKHSGFKHSLSC